MIYFLSTLDFLRLWPHLATCISTDSNGGEHQGRGCIRAWIIRKLIQDYKRVEEGLNEKHRTVKEVYDRFKALLDDVKKKEHMKQDLEKIQEAIREFYITIIVT